MYIIVVYPNLIICAIFIYNYNNDELRQWQRITISIITTLRTLKSLLTTGQPLDAAYQTHTTAVGGDKNDPTQLSLVSDQELNDALSGPYAPVFEQFLDAYMFIRRVNFEKRVASESVFKDAKEKLPENPCNMKDRDADPKFQRDIAPEEILDVTSAADTERRLEQLDALFQICFKTFAKLHQAAYNEARKVFEKIDLKLSEQDKSFLTSDEPLNEIHRRFSDLSLNIPKIRDNGLFFSHYFQLKLILCIQSGLSMRQQPHSEKDIKTKLKDFSNIIETCEKHEAKMIDNQQTNIDEIIKAIKY